MEWVETTAKSVEEAKELAVDKLGVDDADTEFEVLEEPRQGLFGRVRGQARVRARVAPKAPRAKEERRDRKRKPKGSRSGPRNSSDDASSSSEGNEATSGSPRAGGQNSGGQRGSEKSGNSQGGRSRDSSTDDRSENGRGSSNRNSNNRDGGRKKTVRPTVEDSPMEDVTACVEGFLTGLTKAFGVEATVSTEIDGEHMMAKIEGKHGLLLGPKARTLDAIQELTRVTAQRATPSGARIKVDVGGYREARRLALAGFAQQAAERAVSEGVEVVLEPMNSADRKVVHDALTDVVGVSTRSAGNDPSRRVIVVPETVLEPADEAGPEIEDADDAGETDD